MTVGDRRMTEAPLIVARPQGLYCPPGDFYIDPWRDVDRAVITHAHGDHARPGHARYLAATSAEHVLRTRLGAITLQTIDYGEPIDINGVRVSLHPAGHVLGSSQVRVEKDGRVWVASGDYKLNADVTCLPFEPVRCDAFITESTFVLPIYRWDDSQQVFADINAWWSANADSGRASVLFCYAFGKAQRILSGVDASIGRIVVHGAVEALTRAGVRGRRVLIPRAAVARDLLPDDLRAAGAEVDIITVYRTMRPTLAVDTLMEQLRGGHIHLMTFASSSTVLPAISSVATLATAIAVSQPKVWNVAMSITFRP
jgi:putative mRNA 3-end processing factor